MVKSLGQYEIPLSSTTPGGAMFERSAESQEATYAVEVQFLPKEEVIALEALLCKPGKYGSQVYPVEATNYGDNSPLLWNSSTSVAVSSYDEQGGTFTISSLLSHAMVNERQKERHGFYQPEEEAKMRQLLQEMGYEVQDIQQGFRLTLHWERAAGIVDTLVYDFAFKEPYSEREKTPEERMNYILRLESMIYAFDQKAMTSVKAIAQGQSQDELIQKADFLANSDQASDLIGRVANALEAYAHVYQDIISVLHQATEQKLKKGQLIVFTTSRKDIPVLPDLNPDHKQSRFFRPDNKSWIPSKN